MLNSRLEFLNILKSKKCKYAPYSLDVESLFTNVPVHDTIDIILNNVYNHETINPPNIPINVLRELLLTSTTKVPFRNYNGTLYMQIDGVSMGSPLGPTFANFYMCHIENNAFKDTEVEPNIYVRYVDDIFIDADKHKLLKIKYDFENNSKLKFTYEEPKNNTLPFLDILVKKCDSEFETSVYYKKTDFGKCLNYKSECSDLYKLSVIKSYVNRAIAVCSTWELVNSELNRVKQVLINNSFPQILIEKEIKSALDKYFTNKNENEIKKLDIYFENQMNSAYKIDEKVLKNILKSNIVESKMEFSFYF